MPDRVVLWQDAGGEWRWHRKAGNGEIISTAGEGYKNREWALQMAQRMNPDVDWDYVVDGQLTFSVVEGDDD